MPHITQVIADMRDDGPILEAWIGPSQQLAQALTQQGQTVPTPVRVLAMIDTGASGTVVNPSTIQQLGISPTGSTTISTPSTVGTLADLYDVSLRLSNNIYVGSVRVLEASLQGQPIQCLIGRDLLQHAVLTYMGHINQFTLSF